MEEELKEDIEILRNTLERYCYKSCQGTIDDTCKECKRLKAIENILNRLEQDERIIKEMAEYIEYVSSDGDKDVMYAELYNCNQLDRDWTRGKEAEIKDILKYFRKKCE